MDFDWLTCGYSPLPVNPSSVHFIKTPSEFYEKLLNGIKSARKRVILSTLYLGTGPLEQALVNDIKDVLKAHSEIRVGILMDYLRGTRGGQSSSASFLKEIADGAEVYFYHTPDLRGPMKSILGERTNEIIGLQHMKFYIFDDSILISGANLADLYFTHRQDRYVFIENCPALANFFSEVFDAVTSCSFQLRSSGELDLCEKCLFDPVNGRDADYRTIVKFRINEVLERLKHQSRLLITSSSSDTWVYPFLQWGAYGIRDEENILLRLFSHKNNDFVLTMASGYFNLFDRYSDAILHKSTYPIDIILASPNANGFFNGHGLSGYIPSLYVYVSELFYNEAKKIEKPIKMFEYNRSEWTFHAKGIWMDSKNSKATATIFGSSNYGYRSANRDLEAQVLLVTSNDGVKEKLADEKRWLMEFTSRIETATFLRKDHYVPDMVLMQKFGFGLLAREILTRRAGNQIHTIGRRNIGNRGLHNTNSSISRSRIVHPKNFRVNPFSADELKARIGGSCTRHSTRLLSNDISKANLEELLKDDKNCVGMFPIAMYWYSNEQIMASTFSQIISVAIMAPVAMFYFTRYYNRIIGVISMDSTNTYELGDKAMPIIKMRFYESNKVLYLSKNKFEVVDKERAGLLFGDVSKLKASKEKED